MPTENTDLERRVLAHDQTRPDASVIIHTARTHGVWHVTRNGSFVGDYLAEGPARAAAAQEARMVERRGGRPEVLFGPNP